MIIVVYIYKNKWPAYFFVKGLSVIAVTHYGKCINFSTRDFFLNGFNLNRYCLFAFGVIA